MDRSFPSCQVYLKAPLNIKAPHLLKVGNSLGVILPKEVLAKLGLEVGDLVNVIERPDAVEFRPHDAGLAEQMAAARAVIKKQRAALRDLARQTTLTNLMRNRTIFRSRSNG
jgi:putative addiction module antidote